MRSRTVLISVMLLLIAGFLLSAAPAMADKGSDPPTFTAIITDCEVLEPGTKWVDAEGFLHIRDLKLGGFVESDNALVAGREEVTIVSADITSKTGNSEYVLNAVFFPTAVEGTWILPCHGGRGHASPNIHHGYGTGALEGMRIQFTAKSLQGVDPGVLPCAEPLNVLEARGVILPPPGSK